MGVGGGRTDPRRTDPLEQLPRITDFLDAVRSDPSAPFQFRADLRFLHGEEQEFGKFRWGCLGEIMEFHYRPPGGPKFGKFVFFGPRDPENRLPRAGKWRI